jgi:hypothetical protein
MRPPARVQIGDRVRIARYFVGIPAGSIGTVLRIFVTSHYCDVRFDGFDEPQLVHNWDLELVSSPDLPRTS